MATASKPSSFLSITNSSKLLILVGLSSILMSTTCARMDDPQNYFEKVILKGEPIPVLQVPSTQQKSPSFFLSSSHENLQDKLNTTVDYNGSGKYEAINYGHAFMAGFESKSFAQNITACYDSWLYFYYVELMHLEIAYHYADIDDMVFNTTKVIGSVAEHMQLCTSFFQGFFYFYYNQKDAYEDASAFFISFFQNILANILNINTIYQAMEADLSKTNNMTDVFYQAGKIAHIVLDVVPIVPMEDDSGYDSYMANKMKKDDNTDSSSSSSSKKPPHLQISEGAQSMISFDGFMNFTVGILAGSSVTTNNTQLDVCRNSIHTEWYFGYQIMVNHAISNNQFGVAFEIFSMLKSIHPIALACFGGMESSLLSYYDWSANSTSVETLFTNFGLNLGVVLSNVKDVTLYFIDTVYYSNCQSTQDAGYMIGAILKSFFLEPPLKTQDDTNSEVDFWGQG